MSSAAARAAALDIRHPELDAEERRRAASSEDAFDAAVSALEARPKSPDLQGWWGEIALGAPRSLPFRLGCVEILAAVGHQTRCSPTDFSRCRFSAGLLVSTSAICTERT